MALTLEAEQRLTSVKLVEFFQKDKDKWTKIAKETFNFVREQFPPNSTVRTDDVAKPLFPLLEVNPELKAFLSKGKLTQKYWISDFAALILDRTWGEISKKGN